MKKNKESEKLKLTSEEKNQKVQTTTWFNSQKKKSTNILMKILWTRKKVSVIGRKITGIKLKKKQGLDRNSEFLLFLELLFKA